jgi:hypothetical protein
MADDPSSTNFANNGAILMTLLSAGALVFSHFAPLQDARPDSNEARRLLETATNQTVDARLWQDPFAAVAKAVSDQKTAFDCGKSPSEDFCKKLPNQLDIDPKADPSIIVATVSAAPYTEQEETRRRLRYALVSGLHAMGFVPTDAQHIGYAVNPCDVTNPQAGHDDACNTSKWLPRLIPFEKFRSQKKPDKEITLLWLDEDMLAKKPLAKISTLAKWISDPIAPSIQVIGPSWSDTLRDLMREACGLDTAVSACDQRPHWPQLKRTTFYAYGATVNDASLFSELKGREGREIGDPCAQSEGGCADGTVHDFLAKRGVYLLRTIATDDLLAKAIVRELHFRGVDPGPPKQEKGPTQHIALISEFDSYYGRTFPQFVRDCADVDFGSLEADSEKVDEALQQGKRVKANPPCKHKEDEPNWLHMRTYLHGLDGVLPKNLKSEEKKDFQSGEGGANNNENSNAADDKDSAKRQLDQRASERAFGQGQFDYLRRLASDLKEEDDGLKRKGEGIKAIGVVGGDVFDKLLVLRALRPEFPDAVFFTDDFDALLSLQSELRWTRNLLVASSFGPKLTPDRQNDLPPFRDVLETSAFLATQLAVGDLDKLKRQEEAPQAKLVKPPPVTLVKSKPRPFSSYAEVVAHGSNRTRMSAGKRLHWDDLIGVREASRDNRFRLASSFALAEGRSVATAGETEARPEDPFGDEQRTITSWLQKPRMFEVERTGGMLALSEDPELTNPQANCKDDLTLCKSIQPQDPPAYSAIAFFPQLSLGAVFTVLWVFCAFKLNAIRSKYRRQTRFDHFVYFLIFVALVLFILAGGVALAIWWRWPSSANWLTHNRDPMVLIQGVSVWPAIYIRVFTLGLTLFFIVDAWRKLDENLRKVSDRLGLGDESSLAPDRVSRAYRGAFRRLGAFSRFKAVCGFFRFKLSDEPSGCDAVCNVNKIWRRYVIKGQPVARFLRVFGYSVLAFAFTIVLWQLFGVFAMPGRGDLTRQIYEILATLNFGAFLFLVFFVLDATLLCANFVICLANRDTRWPDATKQTFVDRLGLGASSGHTALDDWIDVYFIAQRTNCIAGLIYYPLIITALIVVCHSSIFGNFPVMQCFVVVMALSVAIVVGCAIWLNVVAELARYRAQKHLSDEIVKVRGQPDSEARATQPEQAPDSKARAKQPERAPDSEARAKQWENLLDRVRDLREGSFLPFWRQPVVTAVLLPLGSLGWTTLLEGGHLFGL